MEINSTTRMTTTKSYDYLNRLTSVNVGDSKLSATISSTGDAYKYQTVDLGTLEIQPGDKSPLSIHPGPNGWKAINLKAVHLKPVE